MRIKTKRNANGHAQVPSHYCVYDFGLLASCVAFHFVCCCVRSVWDMSTWLVVRRKRFRRRWEVPRRVASEARKTLGSDEEREGRHMVDTSIVSSSRSTPHVGISTKAMSIMNSFVDDLFEKCRFRSVETGQQQDDVFARNSDLFSSWLSGSELDTHSLAHSLTHSLSKVKGGVHPDVGNSTKSDEHHELLRQRPLRKSRLKSVETGQKQDDVFARNSNFSETPPSRRTGEACCQRRNQSCYEVHELEVIRSRENQKALFRATHIQNKLLALAVT